MYFPLMYLETPSPYMDVTPNPPPADKPGSTVRAGNLAFNSKDVVRVIPFELPPQAYSDWMFNRWYQIATVVVGILALTLLILTITGAVHRVLVNSGCLSVG